MRYRIKPSWVIVATLLVAVLGAATISALRPAAEAGVAAGSGAARGRPVAALPAGTTRNVPRDFAATMIRRDPGAIDMSLTSARGST